MRTPQDRIWILVLLIIIYMNYLDREHIPHQMAIQKYHLAIALNLFVYTMPNVVLACFVYSLRNIMFTNV